MPFRDDSLPVIAFDPTLVSLEEGGYVTFTVTLSEAQDQAVTFEYATVAGSATSATDYNATASARGTFAAGETTQTFRIYTRPDSVSESDESFFVEISNPVGASFGNQNHSLRATGWILDDDAGGGQRAVAVAAPVVVEEEDGIATFNVTLSEAFDEETTLSYQTVSGSARAGKDFTAASGEITFAAGEKEATVEIALLDDGLAESAESFGLKVTGAGLAAFGEASVLDDDAPLPVVSVEGRTQEEGGYTTFTLRLSKPSTSDVTIDYLTVAGSATAGTDFSGSSGKVTFEAGSTTETVRVYTRPDSASEADESFFLRLANPVGASFGPGDAAPEAIAWILDDDPGAQKRALNVTGSTALEVSEGKAGQAIFTVSISRALDEDLTLSYATRDGTAKAGSDYVKTSGNVTIAAGATEAQVAVTLVNSTSAEKTESFGLSVSGIPSADFAPSGGISSTGSAKIADGTIKGTSGADVITGTIAGDRIEAGSGNDRVYGKEGSDRLYGSGGNDRIYGGDGNDLGYGGTGSDSVYGGDGNDKLYGSSGNDRIVAGEGNDRLYGGTGTDRLYGGDGDDTFVFVSVADAGLGATRDRIYDFDRADDAIDISGIDANTLKKGNQAFDYIGSKGYSGEAGELRFSGGVVAGDVNGDGKSDFHIGLADISKLGASDFIL